MALVPSFTGMSNLHPSSNQQVAQLKVFCNPKGKNFVAKIYLRFLQGTLKLRFFCIAPDFKAGMKTGVVTWDVTAFHTRKTQSMASCSLHISRKPQSNNDLLTIHRGTGTDVDKSL